MRSILFLCAALLVSGCATVKTNRPDGTTVTYTGPAAGAELLIDATDPNMGRALQIADRAVATGQPVSVETDNVSLQSGYGWGGQMGQFPGSPTLPVLAPATGATQPQVSPVIPVATYCPENGIPRNLSEQVACGEEIDRFVLQEIQNP